ncbi:hypothetical protein KIN20_000049 [Parelaphostrongylus tenuis]|uniref:Uncharacterized protein n=1 Tax=Parelaphostrongylus tenuis TaxID=148309 RepID=A0AAD5MCP5_PARTN|nr:hypothetical protein KIN20_000049 [Parelaphostrongylus tenuis]
MTIEHTTFGLQFYSSRTTVAKVLLQSMMRLRALHMTTNCAQLTRIIASEENEDLRTTEEDIDFNINRMIIVLSASS